MSSMNEVAIYFSIISGLAICFSLITCVFSILAYAKVIGLENSTHKIEWVPVDQNAPASDDEKELDDAFLKSLHDDLEKELI